MKPNRNPNCFCRVCNKGFYVSPSRIEIGYGKYCSKTCYGQSKKGKKDPNLTHQIAKGTPPWNKGIEGYRAGEKHHFWKGGVTGVNHKIRMSLKMKQWRIAVFERDNYTCQGCNQRGGNLEADHIKQFAYFPALRFDVDNGRTLCKDCHKKTPTYSRKVLV